MTLRSTAYTLSHLIIVFSLLSNGCTENRPRPMALPRESISVQKTAPGVERKITKQYPDLKKGQTDQKNDLSPVEQLKAENNRDAQKAQDKSFNSLNRLSQAILDEAFEEIRNQSIIPDLASHKTPNAAGSYGETLRRILRLDQYSQYLSPREYSTLKNQLSGNSYTGIGMYISRDHSGAIIAETMVGSPADKAGIRNGDVIVAINSVAIQGRTILEVSSRIRGIVGSSVNITYQRNSAPAETVTIKREKFMDRTVSVEQNGNHRHYISKDELSKSVYLRISSFDQQTDDQFFQAMSQIPETMPIILDLCGNAGGNIRIALQIAESFLPLKSVLSNIVSRNSTEVVESKEGKKFKNPITILQDSKTASAAEAFIAAMVDNKRALSVGESTFGKAQLQTFIELSDGSAMLLTTAKLMTPSQHDFDKVGIAPSIPNSSGL